MPEASEIDTDQIARFRRGLLDWFALHSRDLPWRQSNDAYQVWVSEIMLQQTRVDQARPFFEHFVERFPNVETLAEAEQDDVLLCWEGLGYYSRARNLHKAARQIVDRFDGVFPQDIGEARTLPGVGPYTAAAVLSIAYGKPVAAVDGNVTRVLARYLALEMPVDRSEGQRVIRTTAERLLAPEAPDSFNQAMMDLGATICTPTSARCDTCPISEDCLAFANNTVGRYPIAGKKRPVPHFEIAVGVVGNEFAQVLLTQRPDGVLLGGLWEFPGARCRDGESLRDAVKRGLSERVGLQVEPMTELLTVRHAFSHFRITMHAFSCRAASTRVVAEDARPHRWIALNDMNSVALHRAARRIANHVSKEGLTLPHGMSFNGGVH